MSNVIQFPPKIMQQTFDRIEDAHGYARMFLCQCVDLSASVIQIDGKFLATVMPDDIATAVRNAKKEWKQ